MAYAVSHISGARYKLYFRKPSTINKSSLFMCGEFTGQFWLFWVEPIADAMMSGFRYKTLFSKD